ncbi:MAG: hypothetical protein M1393_02315 [Candidatus Thermoplasmatota archaeon]|nr:hypothetical protein [Candidatus Thermoplasmatota archaeon]MDA8143399.1 hypothetical protein [Thermoplasmatales archaeon]
MDNVVVGIKAGLIGGIAWGGIESILPEIIIHFGVFGNLSTVGYPLQFGSSVLSASLLIPLVMCVLGIIGGIIFGTIFAAIHDKIPGKSGKTKGVYYSLIIWLISNVSGLFGAIYTYGLILYIGSSFTANLVFGLILGTLFEGGIEKH